MKRLWAYALNAVYLVLTTLGIMVLIHNHQDWSSGLLITVGLMATFLLLRRHPGSRIVRMELMPQILTYMVFAPVMTKLSVPSIQTHELWAATLFALASMLIYCLGLPSVKE